ncbi:hypothetical protein LWI28_010704 [Acer negundo]|uniref:Uncharacterized protein n=1 Tax=Acer negundo TaxID=4023 RepID=A0AAD5NX28_ACENE|nr:hypothetical protein LWI28_010704 [Acer negundo]
MAGALAPSSVVKFPVLQVMSVLTNPGWPDTIYLETCIVTSYDSCLEEHPSEIEGGYMEAKLEDTWKQSCWRTTTRAIRLQKELAAVTDRSGRRSDLLRQESCPPRDLVTVAR